VRRREMDESYFDRLYDDDADPWRLASSEYENAKYAATLAALPDARYKSALEVGCSIGVFTRMLVERCDALLAIDPAERALEAARRLCKAKSTVKFERMAAPDRWPQGAFDLIILSEVVYYFTRPQIARLAERVEATLRLRGHVILVHWLGETDYPLSGDEAVSAFLAGVTSFTRLLRQERALEYRLDLIQRR
jgi:SAM-dependent methyltransferase